MGALRGALFSAALLSVSLVSSAHASTVVTWNGANNFNDNAITFTAISASQLTSVSGPGVYEANLLGTTTFDLQVHLSTDSGLHYSWVTLKEWTSKNILFPNLSTLLNASGPYSFGLIGLVNGIQLTSDPDIGIKNFWAFKSFLGSETFTFDTIVSNIPNISSTPIPTALPLFAGGLVLVGLLTRRRKRTARKA